MDAPWESFSTRKEKSSTPKGVYDKMPQNLLNQVAVQCTLMGSTFVVLGENIAQLVEVGDTLVDEINATASQCRKMGLDFQAREQHEVAPNGSALAGRILDQAEGLWPQSQALNRRIDTTALKQPGKRKQQLDKRRERVDSRRAQARVWRNRSNDELVAAGERRKQDTNAQAREAEIKQAAELVTQARSLHQSVSDWCEQGKILLQQIQ